MKKILLLFMVLMSSSSLWGSDVDSSEELNAFSVPVGDSQIADTDPLAMPKVDFAAEARRAKRIGRGLKIAGWSSLGVGAVATWLGVVAALLEGAEGGGDQPPLIIGVIATGGGLMVASVPLLIMGYKYARKAKALQLKCGMTMLEAPTYGMRQRQVPALGITLSF